jgi:hypothetical protein
MFVCHIIDMKEQLYIWLHTACLKSSLSPPFVNHQTPETDEYGPPNTHLAFVRPDFVWLFYLSVW